jgi:phosphatidylglycerophosphate synthase
MSTHLSSPSLYPMQASHQRPDGVRGEWEILPPSQWNTDQNIAAATGGFATLANLTTLLGAGLTHRGLHDLATNRPVRGTTQLVAGRLADLLDGQVAKNRGTRSAVGAAVDAGADKLLLVDAWVMLTRAQIVPPLATTAMCAQQTRIMAKNTAIKQAGGEPNPNAHGKHAMFASWSAIALRCSASVLKRREQKQAARVCRTAAALTELVAVALSERAIRTYDRQLAALPKN